MTRRGLPCPLITSPQSKRSTRAAHPVDYQPPTERHKLETGVVAGIATRVDGVIAAFKHRSNLAWKQTFRDSFKPQSAESKRPAAAGFIGELHAAGGEGELHGESLR